MISYDMSKATGGMMTPAEKESARLDAVMAALDGYGPERWWRYVDCIVRVGLDDDGRYTVSGDENDPFGHECAGSAAREKLVALLLEKLPLDETERARFELAREVWGGRRLHPAIEEEFNTRRTRPTVSEAELLVRRLTRSYFRAKPSEVDDHLIGVPLEDGTAIVFGMVGRNASHEFYLGWDQSGGLWRTTSGEDWDAEGNEIIYDGFSDCARRNMSRVAEAPQVSPEMNLGYIGHY
jgi:hypothetical protein